MNIHEIKCELCGKTFDARDLSAVFSHDMFNKETGQYECKPVDVPFTSAIKVGDSVEFTKDGRELNLN